MSNKIGKNCLINADLYPNQVAIWGDSVSNLAVDIIEINNQFEKSTYLYLLRLSTFRIL